MSPRLLGPSTLRLLGSLFFTGGRILLLTALLLAPSAASAQIAVVSGLSEERDAKPGEAYEGIIEVRNETGQDQEVRVYQTDYLFFADGTNVYGDPGTHPRSNASWISYGPDYLVVPAGQTATVQYSVAVPPDPLDSLQGSYWSILMVEGIPRGSSESALEPQANRTQVGIRTALRFGVQITTNVGREPVRKVAFANPKLRAAEDGSKLLEVDLLNEGDLAVRPKVWLELYDANGNPAGRIDGTALRMYPGTSVRQRFDFGTERTGTVQALLFVDTGGTDVFGAQYTLQL